MVLPSGCLNLAAVFRVWKRRGGVGGLPRAGPDLFLHHAATEVSWDCIANRIQRLRGVVLDLHHCNSHRLPVLYIRPQMGPASLFVTLKVRSLLSLPTIWERLVRLMGYP
jgi:hypothetical protein